jgi:hypothetical protein
VRDRRLHLQPQDQHGVQDNDQGGRRAGWGGGRSLELRPRQQRPPARRLRSARAQAKAKARARAPARRAAPDAYPPPPDPPLAGRRALPRQAHLSARAAGGAPLRQPAPRPARAWAAPGQQGTVPAQGQARGGVARVAAGAHAVADHAPAAAGGAAAGPGQGGGSAAQRGRGRAAFVDCQDCLPSYLPRNARRSARSWPRRWPPPPPRAWPGTGSTPRPCCSASAARSARGCRWGPWGPRPHPCARLGSQGPSIPTLRPLPASRPSGPLLPDAAAAHAAGSQGGWRLHGRGGWIVTAGALLT